MRCILIIIFLIGMVFYISNNKSFEYMKGNMFEDCPNILLQEGKELLLLNTEKAKIPGINPIHFENLEDYVEYLEWQRNTGVFCPVLYLQKTYDSQNQLGYRILPDPFEPNAGLPSRAPPKHMKKNISGKEHGCKKISDAGRNPNKLYNKGGYPGYDPLNQYIGEWNCLDEMKTPSKPPKRRSTEYKNKKGFFKEGLMNFPLNPIERETDIEDHYQYFQLPYSDTKTLKRDEKQMASLDDKVQHNRFFKHS